MTLSKCDDITFVKKVCILVIIAFAVFGTAFYILGGDSLFYKKSNHSIEMVEGNSGSIELLKGDLIEQHFTNETDIIRGVDVQWGTYLRENSGTISVELIDDASGVIIASNKYDAAKIEEGETTTLSIKDGEEYRNHKMTLRLSSNSARDNAVTPLIANGTIIDNEPLYINDKEQNATLCFSTDGETKLLFGEYYWYGFALILIGLSLFSYKLVYDLRKQKRNYVAISILNLKKYNFLIKQLVSRDFKTKYTRSVLGVMWSFLNPLLMMVVQYFVFSTIFKSEIPNFAAYLLIGIVEFNFFSEAVNMTMMSVLQNSNLIKKVYIPKYIYPFTRTISSAINLAIALIPLSIVCAITGVRLERSTLLALYFVCCLILFCLGLGMLLSASMVFFRDTQFLWSVLSMIWMYATPIFYPESIIPEQFVFVIKLNPLYQFMKSSRMCIIDGVSPEPIAYFVALLWSVGMMVVGSLVFKKSQDKFVLYL